MTKFDPFSSSIYGSNQGRGKGIDVTHDIVSMMNNLIYFSEHEVPI
jgi:hypothetical protein